MAKIGLALSGGGVRAFAHLGVLSNLKWAGVPVNIISGSSMGALIGAVYAADVNIELAKNLFSDFSFSRLFNPIIPYLGISNFEKLKKLLGVLNIPKEFDELKVPLIIAATELKSRKTVYFSKGNLWDAICASMAVPGIFYPVKMGKDLLIDGGVTDNLPVNVLKEEANFVIASDVNSSSRKFTDLTNSYRIAYEAITLLVEMNTRPSREQADFVIDVNLSGIGFADFKKGKEVIAVSQKESYHRITELKKILEEKGYVQDRSLGPLFVGPLS